MSFSIAKDIVELVVLTSDEAFLQTLRDAVGSSRRLWHVLTADKVSDMLVAGQVGILVLDAPALGVNASGFLSLIKRQFPDLVVVVAGNRDIETELAGLISNGNVYRFIHKPMSPARAKLFADAAVKKYEEQRRRVLSAPVLAAKAAGTRGYLILGAITVVAISATMIVSWAVHRRGTASSETQSQAAATSLSDKESQLVGRAAAALADNRLSGPVGDNALELYLDAVTRDPADTAARAGLAEVHERLSARAENALLEERLEEAAGAIETARKAGVDQVRIAFLNSQLEKARNQRKTATSQLRNAAAARAVKSDVAALLTLAVERINEGRLIEPDQDNARYYVLEGLRLDAAGQAVRDAQQTLAVALLGQARGAIERRDFAHAVSLLEAADGIAATPDIETLAQSLRTARAQGGAAAPGLGAAGLKADSVTASTAIIAAAVAADRPQVQDTVVNAGVLTLLSSVPPIYPRQAEQSKTQGWVELAFTVAETGNIRDIAILAAHPSGIFNNAAVSALAKWRYQPVMVDAKPSAQRAKIRIRFALPD